MPPSRKPRFDKAMPGSQKKPVDCTTKEIPNRAKFQPQVVGSLIKQEEVAFLGTDPGNDVTEAWWEEMLVQSFDVPDEEKPAAGASNPWWP